MKVTFEFDLNEIEDKRELKYYVASSEMSSVLWDVAMMFRNELKYNDNITSEQYEIVEKLEKEFMEMLEDNNLKFILNDG